ncbi:DUF1669 domain-containing protein [bacterium SCSIO 12643]|nr:DUF1669 domain-containing protein [bacterium SCSIO 12643]
MNTVIQLIKDSIEDHALTRSEKRILKETIIEKRFDKRELHILRSEIFKIARSQTDLIPTPNLIDWIESVTKLTLVLDDEKIEKSRVYFSPGSECKNAIIHHIQQARSNLKICLFTISDNDISSEIVDAHLRGINVQIITDDQKMYDMGSDIRLFRKRNIPIKVDCHYGHMHHKFCIIDNEHVITGSYNWTKSAEDRNYENIIINTELNIIKAFENEFNELWMELESINK